VRSPFEAIVDAGRQRNQGGREGAGRGTAGQRPQAGEVSAFKGKVVVLSSVPSLDTPVCDMETRRFNAEAGKLGDSVVILTISTDLPFARNDGVVGPAWTR